MNTIEKRKIENVINEDIKQKKDEYQNARREEYNALKEKFEKQPPAEVLKILRKAQDAQKICKQAEKEAEALGWNIQEYDNYNDAKMKSSYNWKPNGQSDYTYHAKELTSHDAETQKTISALERIGRAYTLKIYSGSDEMEKILKSFEAEITKILK